MYKYLTDTKMNRSYYTTTKSSTKPKIDTSLGKSRTDFSKTVYRKHHRIKKEEARANRLLTKSHPCKNCGTTVFNAYPYCSDCFQKGKYPKEQWKKERKHEVIFKGYK